MSNFLRLVEEAAASVCWRNLNYGAFPPTGKPIPVVWKLELFKFMLIHFAECAACLLGCRWGCLHSVDLISLPPLPSFPFSFYSLLLVRQEPRDTYHQDSQKSWTEKSNGKFPGTILSYLKFFLQEMTFSEPLSTFLPNPSYTYFFP